MSGGEQPVAAPVWRPSAEQVEAANATRLMGRLGAQDLRALRARSLDPGFWEAVIEDLELEFEQPHRGTVDLSRGPHDARWFVGAMLNVSSRCVSRWAERQPERAAIEWESERGERRTVTWAELEASSGEIAAGLLAAGISIGDRVGLLMPNLPEAIASFFACARVGAVVVPLFSGFGVEAAAARLRHGEARLLLSADGFQRNGKWVDLATVAARAAADSGVERVVLLRRSAEDSPRGADRALTWEEFLAAGAGAPDPVPLDPDHPLLIPYTSGSSGVPKGAVLSHGGFLVNAAKDAAYHLDLWRQDTCCWLTEMGWIMGPWMAVASGVQGATMALFEGAPASPEKDRVFAAVERLGISVLGMAPTLVRGWMAAGVEPERYDLSSLRVLASSGEPLAEAAAAWLFERVGGGRCPVVNMSGGSEVGGLFLAPIPVEPFAIGSLGGPALGMDMAVLDADGGPLGPGRVGELACRNSWPGMTRGLWRDQDRFIETYWARFPGVWAHGDWASYDASGEWFLHGRSDDTMNVSGQRVGPAEIEAALLEDPGVADAAAIGVPDPIKGTAIWCFVIASPAAAADGDRLAGRVAERVGKPFRPDLVLFVEDLPRTRSGKTLRRVVRALAAGSEEAGDLSALANPEAVASVRTAVASRGRGAADGASGPDTQRPAGQV